MPRRSDVPGNDSHAGDNGANHPQGKVAPSDLPAPVWSLVVERCSDGKHDPSEDAREPDCRWRDHAGFTI